MSTYPCDLDNFLSAYIVTALWSSTDDESESLDRNYSADDLSPETRAAMAVECDLFLTLHGETIEEAIETGLVKCGPDFDAWGLAAHDFWLTRNRDGAGFWDGDWPVPFASLLTDAAHRFGEVNLYIGDDGLIWQS